MDKIINKLLAVLCLLTMIALGVIIKLGSDTEHSILGSDLTELRDSITIIEYQKGLPDSIASHNADSIYLDKVSTYTYD